MTKILTGKAPAVKALISDRKPRPGLDPRRAHWLVESSLSC